ncbi:lactate utilization protein C [Streptomyces sp. NPDC053755]|uniref:LutC/YkgG family protein n=1 Tax=Streptomyces sp. NPDC053755 TaxID=3155815 RepID=UPI00343A947E
MSGREQILARIRRALENDPRTPVDGERAVVRDYARVHGDRTPEETVDLLVTTLEEYRAVVHRCRPAGLAELVARLLDERGARSVIVPRDLPDDVTGAARCEVRRERDDDTPRDLDAVDSVVTGCSVAIAETGTLVLDAGQAQGSRRLTLVPDHHICVVHAPAQVVGSVPQAIGRLDPTRPLTWISGPSATSDIELDRVEGVHGPRRLDVVIVDAADRGRSPGPAAP